MSGLKAGDNFPDGVVFTYVPYTFENADMTSCGTPARYDASKEFKTKKVLVFAVPGAFTPTCQAMHLPSYLANLDRLRANGIDQIICLASNDVWVMSAWGKANDVRDGAILFMTDANAAFSKSIGWAAGERTDRYALVVDHGKVVYAAREKTFGAVMASDAETVLSHL